MDKMMIAVFDKDSEAYKGLNALKDLHEKGDITLYATAVISKNLKGVTEVKQEADEGPVGTALGILTGTVVGLLGGPAAAAAGASLGGMTGLLLDAGNLGVNSDFMDEVSKFIIPGTSALLAEIDEDWVTPVNDRINEIGGIVIRRPKSQVIDDQLNNDSEMFKAEMQELKEEIEASNNNMKDSMKKAVDSVKSRLESVSSRAEEKMEQVKNESEAKIKTLQVQIRNANADRKAKIEKRIAQIKATQKVRSEKLEKAGKLAKEALTV